MEKGIPLTVVKDAAALELPVAFASPVEDYLAKDPAWTKWGESSQTESRESHKEPKI